MLSLIITGALILMGATFVATSLYYKRKLSDQIEANMLLLSQKKSSEVRLGQIAEQMAPFLDNFKYNPKKAHFIGNPIDYVIFEDDEVVFLEVKSGDSRMSKKQRDIKDMISDGKVRFETMQIK